MQPTAYSEIFTVIGGKQTSIYGLINHKSCRIDLAMGHERSATPQQRHKQMSQSFFKGRMRENTYTSCDRHECSSQDLCGGGTEKIMTAGER